MYCARLAENARPKKSPKIGHLGTIAQLCRAISLQLKHVLAIGKKLVKQQCLLHMSPHYGELRRTNGWDRLAGLGHPIIFQRQRYCTALLVGVSQTLWCWTEGATCIRQGDHHVGHWLTFLVLILFSQYQSKRLAGKSICKMTYFVSSGM